MRRLALLAVAVLVSAVGLTESAHATLSFNTDVTPDAIFGSGNANGGWTVDTAGGVELGLRAKVRYPVPANQFNFSGTTSVAGQDYGVYKFANEAAPGLPERPIWNFEFSINTDVDGSSGLVLDDLTYVLSFDLEPLGSAVAFDPINPIVSPTGFWDHAIGDNSTANGGGTVALDAAEYMTLIDENNVAQQSWNVDFFTDAFDPTAVGDYRISLSAFSGTTLVAETRILVQAVPEASLTMVFGAVTAGFLSRRRRVSQED